MCFECHKLLSNETLEKQLDEVQDYEVWNTTTVDHLAIMISGYNGELLKQKSLKTLDNFLRWYEKEKIDEYMPKYGVRKMYSIREIKENVNSLLGKEIYII